MTILTTSADLGRTIRDRRLELGYTQQQLAERVGVARQWIVKVEKGKSRAEIEPLLHTLFQLDLELRVDQAAPADGQGERKILARNFTDQRGLEKHSSV